MSSRICGVATWRLSSEMLISRAFERASITSGTDDATATSKRIRSIQ